MPVIVVIIIIIFLIFRAILRFSGHALKMVFKPITDFLYKKTTDFFIGKGISREGSKAIVSVIIIIAVILAITVLF